VVTMVTDGRPRPIVKTTDNPDSFHFGTGCPEISQLLG
jgi:hypothetical protein